MRLGAAIGLLRGIGQLLDIGVPFRIENPLRNHQRIGGLGERGRAAHDLLPVGVRFGREVMLALCIDHNPIDAPDDRRCGTEDMIHEGFHVDTRHEGRWIGSAGKRWRGHRASNEGCDNHAANAMDADHVSRPAS
jgi:hypothetical protein